MKKYYYSIIVCLLCMPVVLNAQSDSVKSKRKMGLSISPYYSVDKNNDSYFETKLTRSAVIIAAKFDLGRKFTLQTGLGFNQLKYVQSQNSTNKIFKRNDLLVQMAILKNIKIVKWNSGRLDFFTGINSVFEVGMTKSKDPITQSSSAKNMTIISSPTVGLELFLKENVSIHAQTGIIINHNYSWSRAANTGSSAYTNTSIFVSGTYMSILGASYYF